MKRMMKVMPNHKEQKVKKVFIKMINLKTAKRIQNNQKMKINLKNHKHEV